MHIIGDNDWSDCVRPQQAWTFWRRHFLYFDNHWINSNNNNNNNDKNNNYLATLANINITRQNKRKENISFIHNRILFIGVHLVGVPKDGIVKNTNEWNNRLDDNLEFVLDLINEKKGQYSIIVLVGHAKPKSEHDNFFIPLYNIMIKRQRSYYDNNIPFLYVHGDGHEFSLHYNVNGIRNFVDVEVDQGKNAPPLRIQVINNDSGNNDDDDDDYNVNHMPFRFSRYY